MENKLTVNYATAWLMGVDPAATGARLKQYRNANHLTQEGLSGILTDGGDPASRVSISMWESGKNCQLCRTWCSCGSCTAARSTS